jgi:hypothetical protein
MWSGRIGIELSLKIDQWTYIVVPKCSHCSVPIAVFPLQLPFIGLRFSNQRIIVIERDENCS